MRKILSVLIASAMLLSFTGVIAMADEENFATVEALQFANDKAPTIDGVVSNDEWGTPTVSDINKDNKQTFVKVSANDMRFTLWTRYSFTGFYVAVVTDDAEHWNGKVPGDENNIWDGDCLQIRLDAYGCTADQGLSPSVSRDENWHSSYNEFAFALGNDGNTYSYSWHGVVDHADISGGDGRYVVKHDAAKKQTTYELFIPWDAILQTPPHVGTNLGFSIGVLNGDAATGGYSNYIEWGTGIFDGRLANVYGSNRLVFSEARATGGDALVDPNPDEPVPPIETVPETDVGSVQTNAETDAPAEDTQGVTTDTQKAETDAENDGGTSSNTGLIIAIIAVVVVSAGAVGIILSKKKA